MGGPSNTFLRLWGKCWGSDCRRSRGVETVDTLASKLLRDECREVTSVPNSTNSSLKPLFSALSDLTSS